MRRVVYAASFVEDADKIAQYIELQFGASHADAFINDLSRFCELVATQPRVGKRNHGYDTTLHGVVHDMNWIFFQFDDAEARFIHIIDVRRRKNSIAF
ncbi:MAG: type II toxin-antitoxin system RelE/ParE family toxin [Methylocystis sp.]|jgi:plasmid stabilization system protein ParE